MACIFFFFKQKASIPYQMLKINWGKKMHPQGRIWKHLERERDEKEKKEPRNLSQN